MTDEQIAEYIDRLAADWPALTEAQIGVIATVMQASDGA